MAQRWVVLIDGVAAACCSVTRRSRCAALSSLVLPPQTQGLGVPAEATTRC